MQARKNKTVKNLKPPVEVTTTPGANVEEENLAASDQEMDEDENWAKSLTEEPSWDLNPKSRDHNVSYITKLW